MESLWLWFQLFLYPGLSRLLSLWTCCFFAWWCSSSWHFVSWTWSFERQRMRLSHKSSAEECSFWCSWFLLFFGVFFWFWISGRKEQIDGQRGIWVRYCSSKYVCMVGLCVKFTCGWHLTYPIIVFIALLHWQKTETEWSTDRSSRTLHLLNYDRVR